jgi:hypothetical protein
LFSGVPPVFAPFSFSAHISYILGVYFACGKVAFFGFFILGFGVFLWLVFRLYFVRFTFGLLFFAIGKMWRFF